MQRRSRRNNLFATTGADYIALQIFAIQMVRTVATWCASFGERD